jgi:N-acetylglucosaminyl-diphospho-decaprenol L-rhamnosyltransferase
MSAAAVVVTYNSRDHVPACLEALAAAGVEIAVVDNASTDGTPDLVARQFPAVRLLANPDNRGFAGAVNQALAGTDADVVLLVNPDCLVSAGTVRELCSFLAENPDVGVVGPRLVDAEGRAAMSAHPFEGIVSIVASRFGGSLVPVPVRRLLSSRARRRSYDACGAGDRPVAVDWLSGACLAVRSSVLHLLGGLDTAYFMYYEDEELCLQAWRSGAAVVYLPTVSARHVGGASSTNPAEVWPHLYRSLLRFQARHRPRTYGLVRAAILTRAVVGVIYGLVRDALAPPGGPRSRALAWARIAQIALSARRPRLLGGER